MERKNEREMDRKEREELTVPQISLALVVMSSEGGAAIVVEARPRDARAEKRVVNSILTKK